MDFYQPAGELNGIKWENTDHSNVHDTANADKLQLYCKHDLFLFIIIKKMSEEQWDSFCIL